MSSNLREQLQSSLSASYTLVRELGGGGMSRVFVAEERALGRTVVVKVLPVETTGAISTERFKREIALVAKLQHPHIVPLLTAGEAGGVPFYTMPLVEGESLRARLTREGELPLRDAVRVLREVASALAFAHEHGIVHRDIKPDNVLLAGDSAMVTDFGVAKALFASTTAEAVALTSRDVALGTPAYMSPEQASADSNVDHRADVYAFGCLAYELLTGQPPFSGRTAQGLLAAHVNQPPEPVDRRRSGLPPPLAALVMGCLEKRPADRPQRADDLVHALDNLTIPGGGTVPGARASSILATRPWQRRPFLIASLAGAVMIAATAGALIARRDPSPRMNPDVMEPSPVTIAERSLAVLPLANIGDDSANEYFAQGMADELTNALTKVPGLRLASPISAAAAVQGGASDVREVGRRLAVGTVLEGTVRRSVGRLRVSVQLTNVATGLVLWSNQYERRLDDVFQVQDDIANSVVAALRLTLASGRDTAIVVAGTRDVQAHELYLRGRHLWTRRTRLEDAATFIRQAIALDTNYAQAYAALASLYVVLPDWTGADADTTNPRVVEYARQAITLDPTSSEAYASLGSARVDLGQLDEAEKEFERAVAAGPYDANVQYRYAWLLATRGRMDDAIARLRRAHALDPLAPSIAANLANALALTGRYAEAERLLRSVITLEPSFPLAPLSLAVLYANTGRVEEALTFADSGRRIGVAQRSVALFALGTEGYVLGRAARPDDARRVLERLRVLQPDMTIGYRSFSDAVVWTGLGEQDSAFAALQRGIVRGRHPTPRDLVLSFALVSLHKDQRWQALMHRLGFRQ